MHGGCGPRARKFCRRPVASASGRMLAKVKRSTRCLSRWKPTIPNVSAMILLVMAFFSYWCSTWESEGLQLEEEWRLWRLLSQ